jgi:dipeptidyl aminopeptidase/acylaminoacyl peptidase
MPLPDYPGCDRQSFEAPTALPDGRLGYIVSCAIDGAHLMTTIRLHIMAYDPRTGQVAPLLAYPLPSTQIGTGGFAWNPTMTRGITGDGRGRLLNDQLYWITPERWEPLDVGMPQAYGPAWSPDGRLIAFVGAPEQGRVGQEKLDSWYNLYLMEADGSGLRAIVNGFRYPSGVTWSPDGSWLLLRARFGGLGEGGGSWLVEVATGQRRLLTRAAVNAPAWSPDGQRLAALQEVGGGTGKRQGQIVLVEVGPLLAAARAASPAEASGRGPG